VTAAADQSHGCGTSEILLLAKCGDPDVQFYHADMSSLDRSQDTICMGPA